MPEAGSGGSAGNKTYRPAMNISSTVIHHSIRLASYQDVVFPVFRTCWTPCIRKKAAMRSSWMAGLKGAP